MHGAEEEQDDNEVLPTLHDSESDDNEDVTEQMPGAPHVLPFQLTQKELIKMATTNIREFAALETLFYLMKFRDCTLEQAVQKMESGGHHVPELARTTPQIGHLSNRLFASACKAISLSLIHI